MIIHQTLFDFTCPSKASGHVAECGNVAVSEAMVFRTSQCYATLSDIDTALAEAAEVGSLQLNGMRYFTALLFQDASENRNGPTLLPG